MAIMFFKLQNQWKSSEMFSWMRLAFQLHESSIFSQWWKSKVTYLQKDHKQRALSSHFRILVVKALVPERCVIFCWQAIKMFHLFLTSGLVEVKLWFLYYLYTQTTRAKQSVKNPCSESSCARKMCHLLQADYEDVSSFLYRPWKLNDSYIIYIYTQTTRANAAKQPV